MGINLHSAGLENQSTSVITLSDTYEFTTDANGDISTAYGRMDLSGYLDPASGDALVPVAIATQIREPGQSLTAGQWAKYGGSADGNTDSNSMRVIATSRAYSQINNVGIASEGIHYLRDQQLVWSCNDVAVNDEVFSAMWHDEEWGPDRLGHTPLVADLLFGVEFEGNASQNANTTFRLDAVVQFKKIKLTKAQINKMLAARTDV